MPVTSLCPVVKAMPCLCCVFVFVFHFQQVAAGGGESSGNLPISQSGLWGSANSFMIARLGLAFSVSVAAYILTLCGLRHRGKKLLNESDENAGVGERKINDGSIKKAISNNSDMASAQEVYAEPIKTVDVGLLLDGCMMNDEELRALMSEDDKSSVDPNLASTQKPDRDTDVDEQYKLHAAQDAEIERLSKHIQELLTREKEVEIQLLEYYGLGEKQKDIAELENDLRNKDDLIDFLNQRLESLEIEKKELEAELSEAGMVKMQLHSASEKIKQLEKQMQEQCSHKDEELAELKQELAFLLQKETETSQKKLELEKSLQILEEVEVEVFELRRVNAELQQDKRKLMIQLDTVQTQISVLSEREEKVVVKTTDEINTLRNSNEELSKQLELVQNNQLNEVEDLVYLRWINACLRHELRNYQPPPGHITARDLNRSSSPRSKEKAKQLLFEYAASDISSVHHRCSDDSFPSSDTSSFSESCDFEECSTCTASTSSPKHKKKNWKQILKKPFKKNKDGSSSSASASSHKCIKGCLQNVPAMTQKSSDDVLSQHRRTNSSDASYFATLSHLNDNISERRQRARSGTFIDSSGCMSLITERAEKENDRRSKVSAGEHNFPATAASKLQPISKSAKVTFARDQEKHEHEEAGTRRSFSRQQNAQNPTVVSENAFGPADQDTSVSSSSSTSQLFPGTPNRFETETKSLLLFDSSELNIKNDRIQSLVKRVSASAFTDMNDVVEFVRQLDEALSCLTDDYAELKDIDWPVDKADALREAAFEYQHLQKLESELCLFNDDSKLAWDAVHSKMYLLLELVEENVYGLLRTQDIVIARYKEFSIPTDWLLDSGLVGKIKLACIQLARKYMDRVGQEFDSISSAPDKERYREFLLLQGVRFAYRAHQFAGGFDVETMRTFEGLKKRARECVHDERYVD